MLFNILGLFFWVSVLAIFGLLEPALWIAGIIAFMIVLNTVLYSMVDTNDPYFQNRSRWPNTYKDR